jgi:hypothetical protein
MIDVGAMVEKLGELMIHGDGCGGIMGMNEWQVKSKYSKKTYRSATRSTRDPTLRAAKGGKTATNSLSYGTT